MGCGFGDLLCSLCGLVDLWSGDLGLGLLGFLVLWVGGCCRAWDGCSSVLVWLGFCALGDWWFDARGGFVGFCGWVWSGSALLVWSVVLLWVWWWVWRLYALGLVGWFGVLLGFAVPCGVWYNTLFMAVGCAVLAVVGGFGAWVIWLRFRLWWVVVLVVLVVGVYMFAWAVVLGGWLRSSCLCGVGIIYILDCIWGFGF